MSIMQIGAQLYTIRNFTQTEADFARSMEKIAKIGYKVVQVSAIGPIEAKKVKAICDNNGLKIALTHIPEVKLMNNLDAVIEDHQIYDCKYIGLGAMSEKYRGADWLDYFAEDFTPVAEKIKAAGMKFMYHNHSFEFVHFPCGKTIMDALLEKMPADLMGITADTYWLQIAGVDVNAWMASHADRLPCIHLKDLVPAVSETRMAAVGQGNINFPAILDTVSKNGVTEYALVEQDNCYGESPFECLKKSYDHLKKLGY